MGRIITSNFFLTGEIRIGKSTVIDKIIRHHSFHQRKIEGYRTRAIIADGHRVGFAFDVINGERQVFAHANLDSSITFNRFKIDSNVFDTFGVSALQHACKHAEIIVLDEIGIFEKNSNVFIEQIIKCLDSNIVVLGVYQKRATWFAEILQRRSDVNVTEISKFNRINIHNELVQQLEKALRELQKKS